MNRVDAHVCIRAGASSALKGGELGSATMSSELVSTDYHLVGLTTKASLRAKPRQQHGPTDTE